MTKTRTLAVLTILVSGVTQAENDPPDAGGWYFEQVGKISHRERELPWLTGNFNIASGVVSAAVLGLAANRASGDSPAGGLGGQIGEERDVVKLGDDIYHLPPAAGYITSLLAKDYRGFVYMGVHNAISSGVMAGLKKGVGQRRPGDQSNTSFPSGHTNTAFLGAAFMQQRYGSRWGIPSYISAIVVAWSRVYGNKHYVNDTISGASIAMMSAWALVPPYETERRERWLDLDRERRFSYEWEMTFNDVDRNRVRAPGGGGTLFESPLDKQTNEPWANSHIGFEYRPNEKQAWALRFSPWEIRSFGEFGQPTSFAGKTFPANEPLRVAHFLWAYGVQYRHALVSNERWQLRLGVGLTGQSADYEIFVVDDTQPEKRGESASADANVLYAVGHLDFDVRLGWKLRFSGEYDYGTAGDSDFSDWSAGVKLRINSKWDAGLGWRAYRSKLEESALFNDFERSGLALNFVYSF